MPTEAWTTKEELLGYFTQMYTGRRMEILCDTNYKVHFFECTIPLTTHLRAFYVRPIWIGARFKRSLACLPLSDYELARVTPKHWLLYNESRRCICVALLTLLWGARLTVQGDPRVLPPLRRARGVRDGRERGHDPRGLVDHFLPLPLHCAHPRRHRRGLWPRVGALTLSAGTFVFRVRAQRAVSPTRYTDACVVCPRGPTLGLPLMCPFFAFLFPAGRAL